MPSFLFDDQGPLQKANKYVLAECLWSVEEDINMTFPSDVHYVIEGGSLLHRPAWLRGTTSKAFAEMYVTHVKKKYVKATVVFDGYCSGPSTKDMAHMRRKARNPGAQIHFTPEMFLCEKMEEFLYNANNKQKFF